jgi:hypothetical protein
METAVIHGKEIEYDSKLEYGLYFPGDMGFQNYSVLYIDKSAELLNKIPKDKAIEQTKTLRDFAKAQIEWKSTPNIIGNPILVCNRKPVPINDVRKNIENTKLFAENLIEVLSGK